MTVAVAVLFAGLGSGRLLPVIVAVRSNGPVALTLAPSLSLAEVLAARPPMVNVPVAGS